MCCRSDRKTADYVSQSHVCYCVCVSFRVRYSASRWGKGLRDIREGLDGVREMEFFGSRPAATVLELRELPMCADSPTQVELRSRLALLDFPHLLSQVSKSLLSDSHAFFEGSIVAPLLDRRPLMTRRFPVARGSIVSGPNGADLTRQATNFAGMTALSQCHSCLTL